ncbi:MAG: imidazole glycerol phosphate synthase subunit HisH [Planctomycetales bacterium]|nr:imidazole glycerol phosphate synthase subunit HisH [Planctomycetales bacterium]
MLAIVDHQICNLRSVQKAFEHVGCPAVVTDDPAVLADAEKIVLPGVGAFADAMDQLRRRRLVDPLRAAILEGRPFLGICLGLQLLFERSYEHGQHEGLGVLKGEVVPFALPTQFKVPHMGWNQLEFTGEVPILRGLDSGSHFYFVHSYYVVPADERVVAGRTEYGLPFCSLVWSGNLFATQFHPEKSQAHGLQILRNFAQG